MDEQYFPNYVRAACNPQVKAANDKDRSILHLISTPSVDRAGDVVDPSGAELVNYSKNPIVLANHDYRIESIIGRSSDMRVDDDGIWARTTYRDTPLAREAYALAKEGLSGFSIGFRPTKPPKALKDGKGRLKGFHFEAWEMLEYSQVAIPMNQDITQNATVRALSPEGLRTFFVEAYYRGSEAKQSTDQTPDEGAPRATAGDDESVSLSPVGDAIEDALRHLEIHDAAIEIDRSTKTRGQS